MDELHQQRNGMRKISRKHLVIYIKKDVNATELEGISIHFNILIYQGHTGEFQQMDCTSILLILRTSTVL